MLILTYLLSAFTKGRTIIDLQLLLFLALLLLALRTSRVRGRRAWLAAGVALAGSAAAFGAALTGTQVGDGVAAIWKGLVLLLAIILILSRVLAKPTVTVQSIYGALSAYVLIGMMFAAFFAAFEYLGGGGFFASGQPANTQTFQYFSFTTLTTLGYGDFTSADERRPRRRRPGGDDRAGVPGHPGGPPGLRLPEFASRVSRPADPWLREVVKAVADQPEAEQ